MSSRLLQEFKKLQRDKTSVVDEVCLSPHDNVCCWRMKMKDFLEGTSDAQLLREDLAELKRRFGGDGKIILQHVGVGFQTMFPFFRFHNICSFTQNHTLSSRFFSLTLSLTSNLSLSLSLSLTHSLSLSLSLLRRDSRIFLIYKINFDFYTIVSPLAHHKNSLTSLSYSHTLSQNYTHLHY
jgi:hypothetical protein